VRAETDETYGAFPKKLIDLLKGKASAEIEERDVAAPGA
jgi:hypothetical protein